MKWIELSVETDAEGAEAAAAFLNEFVSGGAVIEQIVTPEQGQVLDPARAFVVRAFFSEEAGEARQYAESGLWHLAQLRRMGSLRTRELAEEDWAEAWKKDYAVQHLGRRLVIKPSWLAYVPRADEVVIELDPGMAFGTGLHPTTRLCLAALERRVTQGGRLLDLGTGSGILAIAAAKLGAGEVLALDVDPIAVETAARNAALNHVESVVRARRGTLDGQEGCNLFDLVCINILAEVVCELAPALASALRSGGTVIASGILDYKAEDVVQALRAAGMQPAEQDQEGDWVAIVGVKPE